MSTRALEHTAAGTAEFPTTSTDSRATVVSRPGGVTFIAGWNLILGVGAIALGVASSGEPGMGLIVTYGAVVVVVSIGLLMLQPWARALAIVGYLINVVAGLATANFIGLGIAAWILSYLFDADVAAAFNGGVSASAQASGDDA